LARLAAGNFAKTQSIPLMTADEFKAAMEKAKNVKSSYTAPTATKQWRASKRNTKRRGRRRETGGLVRGH